MSSPSSHPFRAVGAGLAALVLVPTAFLGVVGALTDTGPMRPLFAVMAITSVLGVGGAIHTVVEVARAARAEALRLREARAGRDTEQGVLLGRWSIAPGERQAFATREWSRRKREVPLVAAFIFVIGSGLLWLSEDGPPWAAFVAAGFVSGLYVAIGLGKYGMEYQAALGRDDDVVVWSDAVVVFGNHHSLSGLSAARFTGDALELTIRWATRSGEAEDTVHVPVPPHARDAAEEIARMLEAQRRGAHR